MAGPGPEITNADDISSDIEVLHPPRKYHFPGRSFGNKGEKRSFKALWFDTWPWLSYQEVSDSVICFYCCQASNRNLLTKGLYGGCEEAYITKGFVNWKDVCASFRKHETSKFHIEAVQTVTKPQHNVDEMLSQVHSNQKKMNSHMLLTIMQNV